jgi:hypothetical protein
MSDNLRDTNIDQHRATTPAIASQGQQAVAAKGLAQTFGLDIRAAVLTIIVDLMISTMDAISLETLIPLGIAISIVLGFITYKIQSKWYGDDHDSALIKALIIGLLTAIPVPITPIVAIPSGILGLLNRKPGK